MPFWSRVSHQLKSPVQKIRFSELYSELALNQAVVQVFTKPLFAWRKALSTSHDEKTLYDFARHSDRKIGRLHRQLSRQAFEFREGVQLRYQVKHKQRCVYLFPWEERIVDRMLFHRLNLLFDPNFSTSSYAYRYRGFGLDVAQRRISRLTRPARDLYIIKRDIRDYFPSIDRRTLLQQLSEWIPVDDYLFELLRQRIEFQYRVDGELATSQRGIPFGSPVACFLANLYLTPLDRRLDAIQGLDYFRYADDLLLVSDDRRVALRAMEVLAESLRELQLESKSSHHLDLAFSRCDMKDETFESTNRFRHLGLEFGADGKVRLSRDKARKVRNLFRYAFRRYRRKFDRCRSAESRAQLAIDISIKVLEGGMRPVAIIDYYLKHCDDEQQLRLLDRWLAEETLALALRRGHRKSNFRVISFKRLREMGLPSLRHRRRLLRHGKVRSSFFQMRTERIREREMKRLPGRKAFSPNLEAVAERCS